MKNSSAGLLLLSVLILSSGCATRNATGKIFSYDYQTPPFSLGKYKSPELRPGLQQQDVSVAVAISGGGHRAGNFGIGVLKELERIQCTDKAYNALQEVDYLSTVSGGGIAAGIYISTLYDHIREKGSAADYSLTDLVERNTDNIRQNLERSYHGILQKGLVSLKSLGNLDRGDFLEEEFDRKLLGSGKRAGRKSLVLGDIFVPKHSSSEPSMPMWVANATVYENGSIFPFTPESFEIYNITRYTHNLKKIYVDEDHDNIPLAVGLKASASFPGAVPATTLKSGYDPANPFLHLFDGGLADNLGVTTALRILAETGKNRKVLIVVDAFNGQPEPFSRQEGSPSALQIFLRSTDISLDAWRIRHKWVIDQFASSSVFNGEHVHVIYLAFDDIDWENCRDIGPLDSATMEVCNKLSELRKHVIRVGTSLDISSEQQEELFRASRFLVNKHKREIVESIFSQKCL